MTEDQKPKRERKPMQPLTPLTAAFKIANTLKRVPESQRNHVLFGAASEVGINLQA